ncbi:MAG: ankyrin repeat domain-containing protein [Myxococcota bacterium]
MRRLVLVSTLSLCTSAFAASPEEQKVLDAYLLGSADAAKEAAVVKLLDAKPALARSQEVLVMGLDQSSVEGDLGARGKKLAELALARGADPNGKDKDGNPLLIKYGMFARVAPMGILLAAKGANPDAADQDNRTALHWLATMGEQDKEQRLIDQVKAAATLLLDKKANVNAKDKRGKTPLHISAHNGAKQLSELLLARGADMNAVDNDGYSVLGAALLRVEERKGEPSFANDKEKAATRAVIEVLKKKGAKDVRPK